jgi:flagellar biogenesis protein FliO
MFIKKMIFYGFCPFLAEAAGPGALLAQEQSPVPAVSGIPGGLDFLWAFGAFILVLIILFFVLKLLKRLSRFRGTRGRDSVFEMRGVQPLDNQKYLAAVSIDGRLLVVGVSADRITPLAHWPLKEGTDVEGELDLSGISGRAFKLPEEGDDPLDISIVDRGEEDRQ